MIRTGRRAASALSVLALLGTLSLAACSPASPSGVASLEDGTGSTNRPEASEAPSEGDAVKFAECMREHGVEVPDPDVEQEGFAIAIPHGVDQETADAALEACKEFTPGGGEPMKPNAEQLAQMRAFAKCMREHGIENFPDPNAEGGLTIEANADDPDSIDPMSQEFKDAEEACRELGPKPPAGGDEGPSTHLESGAS